MASRSLNKVLLIGNLTRDPELRYTPQGTAVCTFGLATNRTWVDSSNQKQEEAEFHRIVAWNKLAELCSQLLFKGRKVYVEGRLQTRSWTGQDGAQRTTTEIVISDMVILDSRRDLGQGMGEFDIPESAEAALEPQIPEGEIQTPPDSSTKTKTKKTTPKKEEKKEESGVDDEIPF